MDNLPDLFLLQKNVVVTLSFPSEADQIEEVAGVANRCSLVYNTLLQRSQRMPLTPVQIDKIDEMIGENEKRADIVNQLVGHLHADARELDEYLKENRTLQGMLNIITRRAKDIIKAGEEAERKEIAKEIEDVAKKAIKILQKKSGQ